MWYFTGSQWSSQRAEVMHVTDGPRQDVQQRSARAGVEQWSTQVDQQNNVTTVDATQYERRH